MLAFQSKQMIMKKIFLALSMAVFLFIACDSSDATADSNTTLDSSLANSVKATAIPVSLPVDSAQNIQNNAPAAIAVNKETTAAAGSGGLNPAHGQPGHRCDIAVGAALNSPVTKPTVSETTTTPQRVVNATAPAVKTAPGMNPPHGQPNHRCDIAVGAPLNSRVLKPAATGISVVANEQAAVEGIAPAAQPTDKDNSGKK
ncbi:hypothetical protein BH11BAC4_BH11BAC4_24790 [soil metagenome]